jgi:membrane protein implicated in regulation of membrane protease activity
MVLVAGSVVLALFVLSPLWGLLAVLGAVTWELAEKAFWYRSVRGIPVAVGQEAMIGRRVTATSRCQPDGRVKLGGECWHARCRAGAHPGDELVIERVEGLTLIVGKP